MTNTSLKIVLPWGNSSRLDCIGRLPPFWSVGFAGILCHCNTSVTDSPMLGIPRLSSTFTVRTTGVDRSHYMVYFFIETSSNSLHGGWTLPFSLSQKIELRLRTDPYKSIPKLLSLQSLLHRVRTPFYRAFLSTNFRPGGVFLKYATEVFLFLSTLSVTFKNMNAADHSDGLIKAE